MVVKAVAGKVFHDKDPGAGPDHGGDDEGTCGVRDGGEMFPDTLDVGRFLGKVEFLGKTVRGRGGSGRLVQLI